MPDEPVPVRRAVLGCLGLALLGLVAVLLVRPAIFTFAPPRGDDSVVVASLSDVTSQPIRRELLLSRSYGWDGERDAGDGRVQLAVIVAATPGRGLAAVNGSSPASDRCPVEIEADRLRDCRGRAWTFDGLPLDGGDPPLERFPVDVRDGSIFVDFTRAVDGA